MIELKSDDYAFADFLYLKKILKMAELIQCRHNCIKCECYKACMDIRRFEENIDKTIEKQFN